MRRAYLYTLLALLGWSLGPPGSTSLLRSQGGPPPSPLQVAFWAIGAGWVFLFLVLLARRRFSHLADFTGRGWLILLAMGFFGWAGYAGSLNYALAHLPLPDAVVINYLHPVFTILFQSVIFGWAVRAISGWEATPERITRPPAFRMVMGLALCLVGVAYMATHGQLTTLGRLESLAGAAAALFAAFAWGVYSNLGRFVAVKPGRRASGLADIHTFAAMSAGLVMLAIVLALQGHLRAPVGYVTQLSFGAWGPAPVSAWIVLVVMGLMVYCLGFTLWLAALEAGRAAGRAYLIPPLAYLTPVLTILNGWLLLHAAVGRGFLLGTLLIAAGNGVLLLRRTSQRFAAE